MMHDINAKVTRMISSSAKQTGFNLSAFFWRYEPHNVFTCRWKLFSHKDYSEIISMPEQLLNVHVNISINKPALAAEEYVAHHMLGSFSNSSSEELVP